MLNFHGLVLISFDFIYFNLDTFHGICAILQITFLRYILDCGSIPYNCFYPQHPSPNPFKKPFFKLVFVPYKLNNYKID